MSIRIKLLTKLGYEIVRQKGSHIRLRKSLCKALSDCPPRNHLPETGRRSRRT
ncbi:MAG: type II toxin-antitoxin system HicA family toxin [Candidatus Methanospirareceae archaeon]